jgi:hypothetical protein
MPDRSVEQQARREGVQALFFILCFVALVIAAATWYFTYRFRSGPLTVGGFVLLFAREILVLFVFVAGGAVFVWRKLRAYFVGSRSGRDSRSV